MIPKLRKLESNGSSSRTNQDCGKTFSNETLGSPVCKLPNERIQPVSQLATSAALHLFTSLKTAYTSAYQSIYKSNVTTAITVLEATPQHQNTKKWIMWHVIHSNIKSKSKMVTLDLNVISKPKCFTYTWMWNLNINVKSNSKCYV